ncbi:MAG: signal peptide peptidase SppA [Bacteroidetes bacterium 4484_276]|nr:MAG: signal peptide peptidase SppA [Bacteroidetes bacterium 4484_276]OYT12781.1 MAG: signal peptide peptidase SppA [Bacteroidetes bacterium 4572_114]
MKDFFKFMFASMLGLFIMSVIVIFVFMGIVISFASSMEKDKIEVAENTLLHIKLNTEIVDRTPADPFSGFDFATMEPNKSMGLNDILKNLDKAARDENIMGIYLDLSGVYAGPATILEIRDALVKFKESGKFMIAYSEVYTQGSYYLASTADKIYMNPEGMMDFHGLSAELMFFKGTLEKLDMDMQIIRHGKYKSAVEPFMLDKMSPENREQIMALVDGIWGSIIQSISGSRNVSIEELNRVADGLLIQNPEDAVELGFVDELKYKDQILAELKTLLNIEEDDKIKSVTLAKYSQAPDPIKKRPNRKNKIAVVYALGEIVSGKGSDEIIGSERISKAIRKARNDDKVKAIVMRVNSPGGSALASDVILREVKLASQEKPFIISMGDVAASGGYYIACAADRIFASPTTITGSIGVLGMIPNLEETMKDKLGITFDYAMTNKNSNFMSTFRPLTGYQKKVITGYIEDVYDTFVDHVSDGRDMTWAQVDEIGQGRVWVGSDAYDVGLIDEFGGLTASIDYAAEVAGIDSYVLKELPEQEDPFEELFKEIMGQASVESYLKGELGENYRMYQYLKYWQNAKGVQARLPYDIYIN